MQAARRAENRVQEVFAAVSLKDELATLQFAVGPNLILGRCLLLFTLGEDSSVPRLGDGVGACR